MLQSTWKFIKTYGWKRFFNGDTWRGYVYCRWLFEYISMSITNMPAKGFPFLKPKPNRRLFKTYHGKVLTHELAHALIKHDHSIAEHDLEQIMPYRQARKFVLECPLEIAVLECACRLTRENHCNPTQVCMVIGQPFVDFVLEHHPKTSRRISREEALKIIDQAHERGNVHSAWFKDVCMDRFYVLCNCCKCCCGGIETMTKYRLPMMASSGFVAEALNSKCNQCGICIEVCPFNALKISNNKIEVIWKKCMGCGVCVDKCPHGVLKLKRDQRKPEPLDVRMMK